MSRRTRADAEGTARALVQAGRRLFVRRGFDDTSSEDIVRAAGVTRGALYHHFGGKPGLFREVVEQMMRAAHEQLARSVAGRGGDALAMLEYGVRSFLRICVEPGFHRVLLVDAPTVLGWQDWRALDLRYGVGLLRQGLRAAVAAGQLAVPDVDIASHLLAGALIDGAMLIASGPDDRSLRRCVETSVLALLRGLRAPRT
jgi:AcrR family transcriptional regulator